MLDPTLEEHAGENHQASPSATILPVHSLLLAQFSYIPLPLFYPRNFCYKIFLVIYIELSCTVLLFLAILGSLCIISSSQTQMESLNISIIIPQYKALQLLTRVSEVANVSVLMILNAIVLPYLRTLILENICWYQHQEHQLIY